MIEIYNDKIKDLLSDTPTELDHGVTKVPVARVEEVAKVAKLNVLNPDSY